MNNTPGGWRSVFYGTVVARMGIRRAAGGQIYTLRQMMGLTYSGGQDDVLREVDSIFYLIVGLGIIFTLWYLLRR